MKKLFITMAIAVVSHVSFAQNLENAKSLLVLHKFKQAREELDKYTGTATPQFNMLKAAVYSGLANEAGTIGTPQAAELTTAAETAFAAYRQADPSMKLLDDAAYQYAPVNMYSFYYTAAYTDYAAKNWSSAFGKIKKAVEYSDLLIQKKLLNVALDTNVVVLAGIISENNGSANETVMYYKRLADFNIQGEGFESVYRYLVSYYFMKDNMPLFEKYKAAGGRAYPASEYFKFDKVEFAVGLQTNFNEKIKALEKLLATDAGDYKANEVMGELIYDELNPADSTKQLPANATELEKKMVVAFNKAAAAKTDFENPYLYLGDHFINKAVKLSYTRDKLMTADAAKAAVAEKDYAAALFAAEEPYKKAAALFAARTNLANKDKAQYKKAVSYLADIASYKKVKAKGNAAEQKKWDDELLKWNGVYESIK